MKKLNILFNSTCIVLLGCSLILSCCKGKSKEGKTTDTTEIEMEETENMAFCTWKEVSVRETPSAKGKWITSVYLAEKFEFLEERAIDSSDKRLPEYLKIKLKDGKEGWIRGDFVAVDARPAAIIENIPIYKRPDIMTKSDKEFSQMDIVAVLSEQDDWLEVKGKRREGTWYDKGWIKSDNVTYDRDDIGVAVFALRAFDKKDEAERQKELEQILENPDFEQSIFINEIYNLLNIASMDKVEFDFSHFPSSQIDDLIDYFLFEEVNLRESYVTISEDGMQELVNQAINELSADFDKNYFDGSNSTIKINYFAKIYLNLPEFMPKDERASGYYAGYNKDASHEDKLFAFLMHKIDRSPASIKKLYDKYKIFAFSKLSSSVYFGNNIDETVNALLETYEHITQTPNFEEVLKEIYKQVMDGYEANKGSESFYGVFPLSNQYTIYQPYLMENPGYDINPLWLHSFWVRRHAEGNMDIVHKILVDINDHYEN